MMKSGASSIRGKSNQKIQKNIEKKKKKKNQKKEKKYIKEKSKKKENLFSVVLDKICVRCLYPISDSQQYIKKGSCRRPNLSGLLVFLFVIGLRVWLCQGSSSGIEPILLFYLFILSSL